MPTLGIEESKFHGPISDQVNAWVEKTLGPYFERHGSNSERTSKQIHDPVGRIVDLRYWETYILDSPLMQRLRYVRQLGVGHALFPTSAYSRFEHSLGALQNASLMFDSLVRAQREEGTALYTEPEFNWRQGVVRLAALVHDIGHCLFSHVSEKFYQRHKPLFEATRFFRNYYNVAISPSETLSLLILQSPQFEKLLERAKVERGIGKDAADISFRIRACVAGSKDRLSPDAFMAEIVNGPVDCDKLDYLARDSYTAGVPIALDSARLLSKLRLAEVKENDQTIHALAIVPSGARALDELLVSRIFLYDKFYYHPKVMAAEQVIRRGLLHLSRAIEDLANPVTLLAYGDDEFLFSTPDSLAARFGVSKTDIELVRGCDLICRARNRDLPRRAFAFAVRYLPGRLPLAARFEAPYSVDDAATPVEVEYRILGRMLEDIQVQERFGDQVADLAAELGVKGEIFIAYQEARRAGSAAYLPVVLPNGGLEQRPSFLFKSHEWTEAYALNKATSYVFAYSDLSKVHLAAERFFRRNNGLTFAPNCWIMAKVDAEDLRKERRNRPPTVDWLPTRLSPDFLQSADAQERLRRLRIKFASFLNPIDADNAPQLVETWVSQFSTSDLQESAMKLLEHFTYVEAGQIVSGFKRLVEVNPELKTALWLPISPYRTAGKSGDQLMVDLKEINFPKAKMAELTKERLEEAGSIVFFDDSLNSGLQVSALFKSWFGVDLGSDHLESASDKDPQGKLEPDILDMLRRMRVSFVYYSAHPTGRIRLETLASEIGLGGGKVTVYNVIDSSDPKYKLEGLVCDSPLSKKEFLDFLQQRGEQVLAAKHSDWLQDRIKQSALGYGNLQLTVLFRHSISAATPILLWEMLRGPTDFWIPIFPRKLEPLREAIRSPAQAAVADELPEYQGS